jgi:glycosyltransferase involved in cell wall biosynthesis
MDVMFWGTYDLAKPRNRILIQGLLENGISVRECHVDVWSGVEDKSRVSRMAERLRRALRWLCAYPRLIVKYCLAPPHDVVLVGYLGQLDVILLYPFARLRGVPVVWDAFLSLYDTVIEDRRLIGRRHPLAWALYALEWLACRAADRVILDTQAHADYFIERFNIPAERTARVLVGAETKIFDNRTGKRAPSGGDGPLSVLFYGQFIPLHGIDTIIRAARRSTAADVRWVIIGRGQEEKTIRRLLDEQPLPNLEWIPWVAYADLAKQIAEADVCLGIFGATGKAARVIPNKAFQILAMGRPLITEDSPAIRELLSDGMPGIYLIPPADPEALLAAIVKYRQDRAHLGPMVLHRELAERLSPRAVTRDLVEILRNTAPRTR